MKTKKQSADKRNSKTATTNAEETSSESCLPEMETICHLPDGFTAPERLVLAIKAQVTDIWPYLGQGVSFTLEEVCDPAFWEKLSAGERRIAKKILAYLIDTDEVPVKYANAGTANPGATA